MNTQTAKEFLKKIKEEKDKYRLVNGLFIVKYINEEECIFIGEFLKGGTARNEGRTNKVLISENGIIHRYNKKLGLRTTGLGVWKKMDITFKEENIKEILK